MAHNNVLADVSFCHLLIGVTDMDHAPAFYRDLIARSTHQMHRRVPRLGPVR